MNFTITIDGREAIPVRAIPFITGWEMPPDMVAAVMSHDDLFFQTIKGEPIALTAYLLVDGKPHPMLPKEWNGVLGTLRTMASNLVAGAWDRAAQIAKPQPVRDTEPLPDIGLSEWLVLSPEEREQRLLSTCDDDPKANIRHTAHELTRDQWKWEAVEILPAGVFVWRDDFEQAFHRVYTNLLMVNEKPGDRELNFLPWVSEESRHAVLAGFSVQGLLGDPDADDETIAQAEGREDDNQAAAPELIDRNEVIGKFQVKADSYENMKFWDGKLGRPPEWLKHALGQVGKAGKSSMWKPLVIAHCLLGGHKWRKNPFMTRQQLDDAIHKGFPEWLDTWKEETLDKR